MRYWLIKSEPWNDLLRDKKTFWDGVRNHQARNNLKSMVLGDICLFYHSNEGLEIVGVAEVVKEWYPDPTSDGDQWVVVDVAPKKTLKHPVALKVVKNDARLQNIALVRQGRLSVMPITLDEFNVIMELAGEK